MSKFEFVFLLGGFFGSLGVLLFQYLGRCIIKRILMEKDMEVTLPAGTRLFLDGFPCKLLEDAEVSPDALKKKEDAK